MSLCARVPATAVDRAMMCYNTLRRFTHRLVNVQLLPTCYELDLSQRTRHDDVLGSFQEFVRGFYGNFMKILSTNPGERQTRRLITCTAKAPQMLPVSGPRLSPAIHRWNLLPYRVPEPCPPRVGVGKSSPKTGRSTPAICYILMRHSRFDLPINDSIRCVHL